MKMDDWKGHEHLEDAREWLIKSAKPFIPDPLASLSSPLSFSSLPLFPSSFSFSSLSFSRVRVWISYPFVIYPSPSFPSSVPSLSILFLLLHFMCVTILSILLSFSAEGLKKLPFHKLPFLFSFLPFSAPSHSILFFLFPPSPPLHLTLLSFASFSLSLLWIWKSYSFIIIYLFLLPFLPLLLPFPSRSSSSLPLSSLPF